MLFIHRSVEQNLIHDGKLHELIHKTGNFTLSDYNQNTDILTNSDGQQQKMGFLFPDGNTRPKDLAAIFSNKVATQYKPIQDIALQHDIVAIKSCYPNSNITSETELESIKQHYQTIADFFTNRNKPLIILTSPPLTPLMTNRDKASRARLLAGWLSGTNIGNSTSVFNFYDLLATPSDSKHANMLRKEYRRWLPFDSHPNERASREIALVFVDFLQKAIS